MESVDQQLATWARWVIDGNAEDRAAAIRLLEVAPQWFAEASWTAGLAGDLARLRAIVAADPASVHRPDGPFAMPALVAATHSQLIRHAAFEPGLIATVDWLLRSGADPGGTWLDPRYPDAPLSALYGAAGRTRHAGLTRRLLEAGAPPDDGESLYHSVESADLTCTRLLLAAGARVVGTNAIARVLDYDRLEGLRLLLDQGGDANESAWAHHAILRGRSLAHIALLLERGADPRTCTADGISLYRWAATHGRDDVVALLRDRGVEDALTEDERFVAACARGDAAAAQDLASTTPDILARLAPSHLEIMPRLASIGASAGVRTMLAFGWPREVKTGWDATALNHAVYNGDADMAALLLDHGADWLTPHGFGDIVLGTLSYASRSEDIGDPAPRRYAACARALLDHGVPPARFANYRFAPDVAAVIAAAGTS